MTNDESKSSGSTTEPKLFTEKINPLLSNLLYPSESDEPIEVVTCYLNQAAPLIVSQIEDWQMLPPSVYVEELPETDFWEPVITEQDWYGEDEKARTARFQQLRQIITDALTVRQVFRVGDSEMDVYLLGRLASGDRAGVKTKMVQT